MRIFVVRCSYAGCFRCEWGIKHDWGHFLEMLLDLGWYAGACDIGGVILSLYFCPNHQVEAECVNEVEWQRKQKELEG